MDVNETLKRAMQHRSDHTATQFGVRKRSWGDIGERTARLASSLQNMGVSRRDRVGILAFNSDNYLEVILASAWLGAIIVPLNIRWSTAEMRACFQDAAPKVMFYDDEFLNLHDEIVGFDNSVGAIHLGEKVSPGTHQHEDLISNGVPIRSTPVEPDDIFGIFYTGGTTGRAKGAMISHQASVAMSLMWAQTLHFNDSTTYLHSASFFHLAGAAPLMALVVQGGTNVILPKFEPIAVFEAIEEHRVNYVLFVPSMLSSLVAHPRFHEYDLSSVKHCEYGAAPMPESLLRKVMHYLPSWKLLQGYGCTEAGALVTSLQWEFHAQEYWEKGRLRSAGRSAAGVSVKIVDFEGQEVERGQVGEIAVRSPGMMSGYWNNPEATAEALRDGWLLTGDGAWMDEEGFIYIVDRLKDMIVSGGENIYSVEVEQAIYSHPNVAECAVFGIPDKRWGEAVHAVVVPKEGAELSEQQIIRHCRGLIGGYKCPKSVEIRKSPLPLTGAGKIQKHILRKAYWSEDSVVVH